ADRRATHFIGPSLSVTSVTMSLRPMTLSSYDDGGERCWKRSCPLRAATSEAARAGRSVGLMVERVGPPAGGAFRGGGRGKVGQVDVVDDDVGVVVLPPDLRVHVVEPRVVGGDEVTPLDDLEGVLRLLVRVLQRAGDRRLRRSAAVEHDSRSDPGAS